jgi:hypothetical protein
LVLDDLALDEIGSIDIHEAAYKMLHNPQEPATTNAEAYAAAYRLAIDAAMANPYASDTELEAEG